MPRSAKISSTSRKLGLNTYALVALARERFGKLDAIVNNAGIGPISPVDDLRVE
jgi:NAD(P)-dependent dehydrogenase (short-subunit alcohol dehydrogenase family)